MVLSRVPKKQLDTDVMLAGEDAALLGSGAAGAGTTLTADGAGNASFVAALPVDDATAVVKGSVDPTKLVRIEADGLTTGVTRVLSMPDADITPDDNTASRPPTDHASDHTDGTDDIQDATAAQKGLATTAQITKLDGIAAGAGVNSVRAERVTSNWNVAVEDYIDDTGAEIGLVAISGVVTPSGASISNLTKPLVFEGVTGDARITTGVPSIPVTAGIRIEFKDLTINSIVSTPTLLDLSDTSDVEVIFDNVEFLFADVAALMLDPGARCRFVFKECIFESSAAITTLIDRTIGTPVSGISLEFDNCQMEHPNTRMNVMARGASVDAYLDLTLFLKNRTFLDRPEFAIRGGSFAVGGFQIHNDGSSFANDGGDATGTFTERHGEAYFDAEMIQSMFDLTGRADLVTTAQGTPDIETLIEGYVGVNITMGPGRMAFDSTVGFSHTDGRLRGSGQATVIVCEASSAAIVFTGSGGEISNFTLEANHTSAMTSGRILINALDVHVHDIWFNVGVQPPTSTTGAGGAISVTQSGCIVERIFLISASGRAGWGNASGIIEVTSGGTECIIRDCVLDNGNSSTPDSPFGIFMDGNFCRIENVIIKGEVEIGIEVQGDTLAIVDCTIDQRDLDTSTGVGIRAISGTSSENLKIIDCIIERASLYGIQVGGASLGFEQCFISGVHINDGKDESIGILLDVRSAPFSTIQNCRIQNDIVGGSNNMDVGIKIIESAGPASIPAQRVWVKGNTISLMNSNDTGDAAIVVEVGESASSAIFNGPVIDNNHIYTIVAGNGARGIIYKGDINTQVSRTTGGSISNNTIFLDMLSPSAAIFVVDVQRMKINNNEVYGRESGAGSDGLNLQNVIDSQVEGNIVQGMEVGQVTDASCDGNSYKNHLVNNTTPESINLADQSDNANRISTTGNTFTLTGSQDLTAGTPVNLNIVATSRIKVIRRARFWISANGADLGANTTTRISLKFFNTDGFTHAELDTLGAAELIDEAGEFQFAVQDVKVDIDNADGAIDIDDTVNFGIDDLIRIFDGTNFEFQRVDAVTDADTLSLYDTILKSGVGAYSVDDDVARVFEFRDVGYVDQDETKEIHLRMIPRSGDDSCRLHFWIEYERGL